MATTYPNLDITIPDEGDTAWYDDLLHWFAKVDAFAGGHFEPLTNMDPDAPELVFVDGQVVMIWVEG